MRKIALILDFSTFRVHASAIDLESGELVKKRVCPYSDGRVVIRETSVDPEMVWRTSQKALKDVVDAVLVSDSIEVLSFSFAGDNLMFADRNGVPCSNIIMYMDPRGKEEAACLARLFGERYLEWTGEECCNYSAAARILYLKHKYPETYENTWYFWTLQQWIMHKIGFEPVNDYSMAARKVMLDNRTGNWVPEIMEELQVQTAQLGRCVPAATIVGKASHYGEIAFHKEIPVTVGAHDCLCFLYGLGVYDEKNPYIANNTGTFDHFGYISNGYVNQKLRNPETFLTSYLGVDLNNSICISNTLDHGAVAEELVKKISGGGTTNDFQSLWDQLREGAPDKKEGLLEFWRLMVHNTLEARRLMEDCIRQKRTATRRIRVGGGAACSDDMMQLRADIFGMEIETPENTEASSVGAAVIGAVAVHMYPDYEEAAKQMVRMKKRYVPSKKAAGQQMKRQEMASGFLF